MILRQKDAYVDVSLPASPFSAEARSVVYRQSPGWVFVDRALAPSLIIVGSEGMEGCWLFGDMPNSELAPCLRAFTSRQGQEAMRGVGCDYLELCTSNPSYESAVREALSALFDHVTVLNSALISRDPSDAEIALCITEFDGAFFRSYLYLPPDTASAYKAARNAVLSLHRYANHSQKLGSKQEEKWELAVNLVTTVESLVLSAAGMERLEKVD